MCIGAAIGAAVAGLTQLGYNLYKDRPAGEHMGRALLAGAAVGGTLGAAAPEATAAFAAQFSTEAAVATGTAAGGAGTAAAFQNGSRIQDMVETSGGTVEVTYKVATEGSALRLTDFSVFGVNADKVSVGAGQIANYIGQLGDAARAQGFQTMQIVGQRVSGANPGHVFDATVDLVK